MNDYTILMLFVGFAGLGIGGFSISLSDIRKKRIWYLAMWSWFAFWAAIPLGMIWVKGVLG